MAYRPSIQFQSEIAPSVTPRVSTGRAFVAGISERGPVDRPARVTSLPEFVRLFGDYVQWGTLYNWIDVFFRSGGSEVYISRVVGDAAVAASFVFEDDLAADSIEVFASSPGEWGNGLSAQILAGSAGGTFQIRVLRGMEVIETSPDLLTADDAVAWSGTSTIVTVEKIGTDPPAIAAATPLTGGTDDRANIDATSWEDSLGRFAGRLGEGQVAFAGNTSPAAHLAIKAHCAAIGKKRVGLLDLPSSPSRNDLASAATSARDNIDDEVGIFLAPNIIVPGIASGTTRSVWPSAVAAGLMARTDTETGSANTPAAGVRGLAPYAIGVEYEWNDDDYDALNSAGVMTFRDVDGIRLYGYRSGLSPNAANQAYNSFNNVRLRMQIFALAEACAHNFLLQEITRRSLADLGSQITGEMQELYKAGAFFGDTPPEAYKVDTGPGVNTPATMEAREIHVTIQARMSQFAELITISLVFVPLTQEVA